MKLIQLLDENAKLTFDTYLTCCRFLMKTVEILSAPNFKKALIKLIKKTLLAISASENVILLKL